jgi:RNA polymerase sigma factor (sigma-70 family)
MHESNDMVLLRDYAAGSSEAAFEELVARRVGFVYSAALRQVSDPHQAEEITQAVFVILAQKAERISKETNLTGWLFKTTRYVALAQQRSAIARRQREEEFYMQANVLNVAPDPVWERISPRLDEALMQLGEKDRKTILMHYFDKKPFADIGGALGMSEVTARKRANRALEKLRAFFSRRGVGSTAGVLAAIISANSVQAAPVGLTATISATAAKGPAVAASTLALANAALKLMAWSQFKMAAIAGAILLLAGATTGIVISQSVKAGNAPSQRKVQNMPDRTTPKGTMMVMI